MNKAIKPITQKEYSELEGMLWGVADCGGMDIVELGGFMIAVVCTPNPFSLADCISIIMGEKIYFDTFFTPKERRRFTLLLEKLKEYFVRRIVNDDTRPLITVESDKTEIQDWANGFLAYITRDPKWDLASFSVEVNEGLRVIEKMADGTVAVSWEEKRPLTDGEWRNLVSSLPDHIYAFNYFFEGLYCACQVLCGEDVVYKTSVLS